MAEQRGVQQAMLIGPEVEMLARPAGLLRGYLVGMAFQMGVGPAPTVCSP